MENRLELVKYFSEYDRVRTVSMVVLLAAAGVMEGFGVAAMLPLIDQMISPDGAESGGASAAVAWVLNLVGLAPTVGILLSGLVITFALKALFSLVAMFQVGVVVARVTMEQRIRLLRSVAQAEWRHVLSYPSGFIANSISREAGIAAAAYREFCQVIAELAQVLVYLSLAFLISWQTATFAIVVGLGIMALLQGRLNATEKAGEEQTLVLRSILARLTDALPSLKPLKAMGREKYLLPLLEGETRAYFQIQKRLIALLELLARGREPIIVAAMAVGLWVVLEFTTLSSASIMVMALLFYRTVTSITNMQHRWATVAVGQAGFRSMMEHISAAEAAAETWPEAGEGRQPTFRQELRLEDLSFSYGEHEVLKGVDANLEVGTFVALVGPSGGGKTTLTDLITGLLRPTEGRILVDGTPLGELDMRQWRQFIGYVPQDPMLFSDTILHNVVLGNEDIPTEEVVEALRSAGAWSFVEAFDDGLEHRIGEEGTELSGGQRQRIAIARALVSKPLLLILDEPTTALDTATEAEVCETIGRLKGKLTILAISHQPAIREMADEVWDLTNGLIRFEEVSHILP
ncbi:ABC transporter ATP-binding protein [Gemmatimonadota bacterium]